MSESPAKYRSGEAAALRLPPQQIEAEQSVLGGLLLDNTSFDRIADQLGADDFYRREHRLIFGAIAGLCQESSPADVIIAKQRNGPTGEVRLTFLGEYTRFENYTSAGYDGARRT